MKHRKEWLGLLAICVLLAGVVGGTAAYSSTRAEPPKVEVLTTPGEMSYADVSLQGMFDGPDLVVRGTYLGEIEGGKPYPDMGIPMEYAALDVKEVLKGSCDDTLNFYYWGGELYIKEAIETAEKEGLDRKKCDIFWGMESTDPRANVIIRCGDNEHFVKPVVGEDYLLFLFYEPKLLHDYHVSADMYGFRHINEQGQVYNPDTKNYDTLEMLEN